MIQVNGLTKHYGSHTALDGIDLTLARGEVKVVIGPSGCGKSTLLRCIGALEPFDGGNVQVDETRMNASTSFSTNSTDQEIMRQLRLNTGMVFQQFHLFPHLTVLENIIEAPVQVLKQDKSRAIQTARDLLRQVHLEKFADRYPRHLSGGEQQRVAIARALAMNPKCLLFDEPTSALDPEMVGEVLNVIGDLAERGMTLLAATHEMGFAREVADEVVMLNQGCVIERGAPSNLFERPTEDRTRKFLKRIMRD